LKVQKTKSADWLGISIAGPFMGKLHLPNTLPKIILQWHPPLKVRAYAVIDVRYDSYVH